MIIVVKLELFKAITNRTHKLFLLYIPVKEYCFIDDLIFKLTYLSLLSQRYLKIVSCVTINRGGKGNETSTQSTMMIK